MCDKYDVQTFFSCTQRLKWGHRHAYILHYRMSVSPEIQYRMCSHHFKKSLQFIARVLLQPERRSGLLRTTFSTLADNIGLQLTPSFPRKIWKPFRNKVVCNLCPSGVLKRLPHTSVCRCFYSLCAEELFLLSPELWFGPFDLSHFHHYRIVAQAFCCKYN